MLEDFLGVYSQNSAVAPDVAILEMRGINARLRAEVIPAIFRGNLSTCTCYKWMREAWAMVAQKAACPGDKWLRREPRVQGEDGGKRRSV